MKKNLTRKQRSSSSLQGQQNYKRQSPTTSPARDSLSSNRSYGSPNASPRLSKKYLGPYHCSTTPSPSREFQEFDTVEERKRRQPMEGQLCKYTNVMKGWQYRWFSLDPDTGTLEYFEKEEHKKQRPRGALHLAGAVISPSDEDSQTFTVHAANGELYRLRAADARGRQHWVDKLRATAEYHTANLAQNAPALQTRHADLVSAPLSNDPVPPSIRKSSGDLSANNRRLANSTESLQTIVTMRSQYKIPVAQSVTVDPFKEVKEYLFQATEYSNNLKDKIGELPHSGQYINGIDKDLLLLKATSSSTVYCLQDCLNILQMRQNALSRSVPNASSSSSTWYDQQHPQQSYSSEGKQSSTEQQSEVNSEPSAEQQLQQQQPPGDQEGEQQEQPQQPTSTRINPHTDSLTADEPSPCDSYTSTTSLPYPNPATAGIMDKFDEPIDHSQDVEDEEEYKDTELGAVDEHKSIILHLLSQLKLGMDLTKVVLPTFILEKRSLLEMFADCMAHPLLFLSIPDLETPEQRMLAVVEWYLTSFHAGRQGSVAKKPFNPIRGEAFHCSWRIPKHKTCPPSPEHPKTENGANGLTDDSLLLTYCAEQVSHHPPISAFYFECPEKEINMNASIWTKSKFMGMSIGVVMVGKICLNLLKHDEEYVFGLPSAYARSILTVPWVELGDKIYITCQKSGYSAAITFHTKPFYGGKLHRVTAEVKNNTGNIICKVQGEWNSFLEFTYENGETKVIDVNNLEIKRKSVRPIPSQDEFESRKMWRHVTNALKLGDVNIATEHKKFLEDRQRERERLRKETNAAFPTKYFHQDGEDWVYKKILKNRHKKNDKENTPNDNVSIDERNHIENKQLEESPSKSNRGSPRLNNKTEHGSPYQCGGDGVGTEEEKIEKEKPHKKEKDPSSMKMKKSPKISRNNKSERIHKNEKSLKDLVS